LISKNSGVTTEDLKAVEKLQWDVLGAWYDMWNSRGPMLSALQTIAKPIIENMMTDKLKYTQVYNQMMIAESAKFQKLSDQVKKN